MTVHELIEQLKTMPPSGMAMFLSDDGEDIELLEVHHVVMDGDGDVVMSHEPI